MSAGNFGEEEKHGGPDSIFKWSEHTLKILLLARCNVLMPGTTTQLRNIA